MLDLSVVRTDKETVITALNKRGIDASTLIDNALSADEKRRGLQTNLDQKLALANALAKEIGELYKIGNLAQANQKNYKRNSRKQKVNCMNCCVPSQIFLTL